MKDYKEILLKKEASQYIKEVLAKGHTLARLLLQDVDLSSGKIMTYLPDYVTEEAAYKFELGGKIKVNEKDITHLSLQNEATLKKSGLTKNLIDVAKFVGQFHKTSAVKIEPVPNTDFWLTAIIVDYIKAKSEGICILENELAKSSDPWLLKRKTNILTFNDEVYHFINTENASEKEIQNLINEARAVHPPLVGIMTTVDFEIENLNDGHKIDLVFLTQVAQKTEKIIIGAYDGEGYLIWEKEE